MDNESIDDMVAAVRQCRHTIRNNEVSVEQLRETTLLLISHQLKLLEMLREKQPWE